MAKPTKVSGVNKQAPSGFSGLPGLSWRNKKMVFGGIGLLCLGFFALTKTDPQGQNWASNLSPFLILGGYALIALGLALPPSDSV